MCNKCSGKLIPMDYPDHVLGMKCISCGRSFWNIPPEAYQAREPGNSGKHNGKDVYLGRDKYR